MDNCLWFAVAQEIRNREGRAAHWERVWWGTDNGNHLDASWLHVAANKLALPCLVSYAAGAKGTLDSSSPPSEIQPVAGAQKYFCFALGAAASGFLSRDSREVRTWGYRHTET